MTWFEALKSTGETPVPLIFRGAHHAQASVNGQSDDHEPTDALIDFDNPHSPDPFLYVNYWENDGIIKPNHDIDRHYTNGVLFLVANQPRWADSLGDWLEDTWGLRTDHTAAGYFLGHEIYTPNDLTRVIPDPTDRPYAGYLYGGFSLQREFAAEEYDVWDDVRLEMGVVGPSSLAEDIQKYVHENVAGIFPEGWDSQISDEFEAQLYYTRKWRFDLEPIDLTETRTLHWQLIPQAGFALGTVKRYLEGGLTIRLGQNLPLDFGPSRIDDLPAATGLKRTADQIRRAKRGRFSWQVYAGVNGRAVQHNLFVDGSDYHSGPGVETEPIIGDLEAGVDLRYRLSPNWALQGSYSQSYITHQFKNQDHEDGYATIALSLIGAW